MITLLIENREWLLVGICVVLITAFLIGLTPRKKGVHHPDSNDTKPGESTHTSNQSNPPETGNPEPVEKQEIGEETQSSTTSGVESAQARVVSSSFQKSNPKKATRQPHPGQKPAKKKQNLQQLYQESVRNNKSQSD